MALLLLLLLVSHVRLSECFTTQSNLVTPGSSEVKIKIQFMVDECKGVQRTLKPEILRFSFAHWTSGCDAYNSRQQQAELFNQILEKMKACYSRRYRCDDLGTTMPSIPCENMTILPDSISIYFECYSTEWQDPIIQSTTNAMTTTLGRTSAPTAAVSTSQTTSVRTVSTVSTTSAVTTSTSNAARTISKATTTLTTSNKRPAQHLEVTASKSRDSRHIILDTEDILCTNLTEFTILNTTAYESKGMKCWTDLTSRQIQQIESDVRDSKTNEVVIFTGICTNILIIAYDCPTNAGMFQNTEKPPGGTDMNLLTIILGSVGGFLLIVIIVLAVVLGRRRKKSRNELLADDNQAYSGAENTYQYQDPTAFYPHGGFGESDEYQDPAMLHGRTLSGTLNRGLHGSLDDVYHDPASLAEEAARRRAESLASADSNVYDDPDILRGVPDGNSTHNKYDEPQVEKPIPRPRPQLPARPVGFRSAANAASADNHSAAPGYSHMMDSGDNHDYAVIRKSRPVESPYFELENDVTLYDSPFYESADSADDLSPPLQRKHATDRP